MEKERKELHWYENVEPDFSTAEEGSDKEDQKKVSLAKYAADAYQWIEEVSVELEEQERKDIAWSVLRGVLHAIRDRLIPEEMFQLSAQLPMLIRGLYFEGYHYGDKPEKFHVEELEKRIKAAVAFPVDAKQAFKAVLQVLYKHISKGELNDIYATMPKDIKQLWDDCLKTNTP
ncbi:DUF2267 domain-containing protein [Fodinibius salsisoli]|uniref:DUF2267 domain-containing protein n=1 Tax=Fodinibius salsisoli TaxID=2820877 RepID=A0ABT3PKX4_9BACT|nr:DUF2267 domain-containing protein [Fodinibius salsisoli]MCW9705864.1 DUF2267 domain-containing protein [Fodinibius salsisoli]